MKPRVFLPSILSGLLLWASFFPLDLGPLAFIALVPWLSLVRAEGVTRRRRYLACLAGGLAFYLPALQWIRVAHPAMYTSWIVMACYCSLYLVLALFLLRRIDRAFRLPYAFTVPVVFVALDYCRAHFPTGFPFLSEIGCHRLIGFGWYMLGYTQHSVPQLLQLADLGGVYLVTALVCSFNGAAFEWLVRQPWLRRVLFRYPPDARIGFYREMWVSAAAACALLASVAYGSTRLHHPTFTDGPRVSAIEADIPQDVKMDNEQVLYDTYLRLSRNAALKADLVIWPETCFPNSWFAIDPRTPPDAVKPAFRDAVVRSQSNIALHAKEVWRTHVLLGLTSMVAEPDQVWRYNSAILVTPDGAVPTRYDKMHLVPFGEYVPMGKTFPFLQRFTPYTDEYSCKPGSNYTRFTMEIGPKRYTFGVIICYEDSDPYIARQYVRTDPVDFLVNISNDGWFRGTEEHEQHLAICRFRAVECRRSVVRAVNMGISAIIDPDGKELVPGDNWRDSVHLEGMVTEKVKLDTRESFYAKTGDWLPAGCWCILVALDLLSRSRRWRTRRAGNP